MNKRNCLVLVLTSALAIGCAAARAQDGQGNPPPGPQPQGPPPGGPQGQGPGPRPKMDPAEMKRQMTERLAVIEKRIADATSDGKAFDVEEVEKMKRDAERLRAHIAQIDKGEVPFPMERRGPGGPDGRLRGRAVDDLGRAVDARVEGPMRGPRPSVEQRLAMLERAVREMHEMFERHNVPPEARERAEREMRERRDGGPPPRDGRPGENRPPEGQGAGPRPERPEGGPPPMGGDERRDDGQRPPRPPMPPRAGGPGLPNMDEVRKQIEAAHDQVEGLRKQLVEAQAALKQAQAQIEELRANAKK